MTRRGFRRGGSSLGISSLVIALALAVGAGFMLSPSERTLEGRAYAVDGDTILLNNTRIRLKGIDAPELQQTCSSNGKSYFCGEKARDVLIGVILGQTVRCRTSSRDRYQRPLAHCVVNGTDLGTWMVEEGWAVSYGHDYGAEEADARKRRAGLWAGEFDEPRTWRRENPRGGL